MGPSASRNCTNVLGATRDASGSPPPGPPPPRPCSNGTCVASSDWSTRSYKKFFNDEYVATSAVKSAMSATAPTASNSRPRRDMYVLLRLGLAQRIADESNRLDESRSVTIEFLAEVAHVGLDD